jgi:hypothetical protein
VSMTESSRASTSTAVVPLTTLNNVVLAACINHGFVASQAAQADPLGDTHDVPGGASTLLALGDRGQAPIGVGQGVLCELASLGCEAESCGHKSHNQEAAHAV